MGVPLTTNTKTSTRQQFTFEEEEPSNPLFPEIKRYTAMLSPQAVDDSFKRAFKVSTLLDLQKIEMKRKEQMEEHLRRKMKRGLRRPPAYPVVKQMESEIKIEDETLDDKEIEELREQQEDKEEQQAEAAQEVNKELNYNSAALSIPFDKTIVKNTEVDFHSFDVFDTSAHEQLVSWNYIARWQEPQSQEQTLQNIQKPI